MWAERRFLGVTVGTYSYHCVNLLKPTGYVMHQQFNIQQLYVLHTMYLCVLCGSQNKQRLFPYTALTFWRRTFLIQILAHPVFKM